MYAVETITPPRLYRNRAMPALVDQSALGQVDAVTQDDIITELMGRGYYEALAPTVIPVDRAITKAEAIALAVDVTILAFENYYAGQPITVRHTVDRPYRCPEGEHACPLDADLWMRMLLYATDIANGYLTGRYSLPTYLAGVPSSLAGAGVGSLSGVGDWLQANPWVVTTLGSALQNYGAYLTAQNVKDELKKAIPSDYLTKGDLPALLAALQQAGAVPTGQAATVQKGAEAATTPSWIMPAVIAGGALLVFMLMRK